MNAAQMAEPSQVIVYVNPENGTVEQHCVMETELFKELRSAMSRPEKPTHHTRLDRYPFYEITWHGDLGYTPLEVLPW